MGMDMTVNQRGDSASSFGGLVGLGHLSADPAKRGEMLLNWLTGGLPKQVEPGKIFAQEQALSGPRAAASAGQGMGGLFGFGSLIGDLSPKPLNLSPLQPGVPYSVPALGKLGGK